MGGEVGDDAGAQTPASEDGTDPTLSRLKDFVVRRRVELGLSQRKLAELAGVSLGTAARLERGTGPPRVSTVPKLEDALQWPRGTFQAIRGGGEPPKLALPPQRPDRRLDHPANGSGSSSATSATAMHSASQYAQALSIAGAVAAVAAVCLEVLTTPLDDPSARMRALADLDAHMRQMEMLITASLPDAEALFYDALTVLSEVHQSREAIQKAAADLS